MDASMIIILLLIIMIMVQAGAVYLLLVRKRFKITSESATQDIEKFLNNLDEEVAERGVITQKHLQTFSKELQLHEEKRKEMLDQVNKTIEDSVNKIQIDTDSGRKEIKKIVALLNEMLKTHLDDVSNKIGIMKEEVKAVKELTQEKDKKIRRYEEGYDQKNIKQFMDELFKIIDYIKKERISSDSNSLEEVEEDLLLLLEKNGVQMIDIHADNSYEGQSKFAKVVGTEDTDDISKDTIIKEVHRNGYFVKIDENNTRVLRPAEVVVYKLIEKEGEKNNG
ncbi:MAG TPA: hypothetical protein EYG74_04320 [Sulfurimonas autotrophica]|nr:hypothetical protein [Sulfurimonas autotrophica]